MKKLNSLIILFLMLVVILCGCETTNSSALPTAEPTPIQVGQDNMLLTFCAMSDVHIGDNNTEESFNRGMSYISRFNVMPDAYLFAGDITNTVGQTFTTEQIDTFKSIFEQYAHPSQMLYCLGPTHDVPHSGKGKAARELFINTFGPEYFEGDLEPEEIRKEGIRHIKIKGFNFFSIDWEGSTSGGQPTNTALNWLKEQLAAANEEDQDKPIFVITHVPGVAQIDSILRRYPQVVCFTGHVHNSVAREDSITQAKKFTSVHCGGMNYYRVNGYERFTSNPYLDLGNIYEFGQALYVQVDSSNNVTITRLDVYNGVVLENKWVVGPEYRTVYNNKRIKEAEKCKFQEDDILNIQTVGDDQLIVSWDACKSGGAGPAIYYKVQLFKPNAKGVYKEIQHYELSSQQVFYPNDEGIPSLHYKYHFKDLDCLDDYAIVVTAVDCWNVSENALVYTNGTYEGKVPAGGTVVLQ